MPRRGLTRARVIEAAIALIELYRFTVGMAAACGDKLCSASQCIVEPFMQALEGTALTITEKHHWQRILRGMIHGFISQQDAGFFFHLPADADESFETAVRCCIDGLVQAEGRHSV